jgi:hypothetical protein
MERAVPRDARTLTTEINRLQSDYTDPLGFWHRYSAFWGHARRISAMFKTLKRFGFLARGNCAGGIGPDRNNRYRLAAQSGL